MCICEESRLVIECTLTFKLLYVEVRLSQRIHELINVDHALERDGGQCDEHKGEERPVVEDS